MEAYAQTEGCWEPDADVKLRDKFGKHEEGGEAIAFFDTKNRVVHKLITTSMYSQPVENLDRIALHNWLFPDTPMKVVGFGRTKANWHPETERDGMFVIHVTQPLVRIGGPASEEDIDAYMKHVGFKKVPKKRTWESQKWVRDDGSVVVDDLHSENAVIDTEGNFRVIDADIRLNTPRLGYGGKYVFVR